MPTYVSPFTGTVVTPTDVSYYPLSFSANQTLAWESSVNPPEVPAARIIDCAASTTGLVVFLPPADEGTLGADILFRNIGANAFTVKDSTGGQSLTINAGVAKYVYLSDNTSAAGVWQNVTFGTGTSYADAATLASYGLTTISGKLAVTQNISNITATPTLNVASRGTTFNWGGGVGTITLPVPSTIAAGWFIGFRNNGTGTLTIEANSPTLINGESSIETNPGDSGFIMYDISTNGYITVGWQSAANVSFTAATYDVDSIPTDDLSLVSFAPIIQTYIAQSGTRSTTLNVTLPAITQVYLIVNNTDRLDYDISFVVDNSSQSPILLGAGETLIVLSDGFSLFPLSETASGSFRVVNGSAALPSYSFNNDTSTGMYLVGSGVLGLSANATEIVQIDNSDTMNPIVTVNARIAADLISGGEF